MKVHSIFYSIQGEGARIGVPSIFIRAAGCPVEPCGIVCDTDFVGGREMPPHVVLHEINRFPREAAIIITGGEPLAPGGYDAELSHALRDRFVAVETSGAFRARQNLRISYLAISPKITEEVLLRNFPAGCDELRYVLRDGQPLPAPSIPAKHYFISPEFDGDKLVPLNVEHCVALVKENPRWRLSLQVHKWIAIS